jgi:hypothetical protein
LAFSLFATGNKKGLGYLPKALNYMVGRPRFERGTIALKDREIDNNFNLNNALHSANKPL